MIKTKILIVDDYPENCIALSNLIAAPDLEIHTAGGAEEALALLLEHDFGLALLDVHMPKTSGFELARLIRGVKRYRHLPIIFVTAHQHDQAVIFEGYETGAVDLLFKPLEPAVVRSKVRIFVELYQQRIQLQQHVAELERLRLEAEAANISKSQFLANMSHEIRTPLAAVMGFADLLGKEEGTREKREEWAKSVRRNSSLLMKLIDDILDLSKIEANRIELESVRIDLKELLQDVNTTLSFKAQEKGVKLKLNMPEFKTSFMGDPTRLKQVLLNVIGNAVKFTPRGEIRVEVNVVENRAGDLSCDRVFVVVHDQGVGISEEQSRRLFQSFSQADASTRRQFGGTGLGLTISRGIARAMGGDIRLLHSKVGVGSTFEIQVQLQRAAALPAPVPGLRKERPDQAVDLSGKRILVVDDSPDNLALIEVFLANARPTLRFAESGPEAIDFVGREKFDLILMDVQMPGMDGHEATEQIRRLGFHKPVIALTAHALKSEHERCYQAGCNEVVTKPIMVDHLLKTLDRYLNPSEGPQSDANAS